MKVDERARVQNLLGALSVGIGDRIQAAASEGVGYAGETAAAIVQIGTTPRMSIEELSDTLMLSHSAVVRLIAKLTALDLVERVSGEDRREVRLVLTRTGKTTVKGIMASRVAILSSLTDALPNKDVAALGQFLELMLERIAHSHKEAVHICRYCDEDACPQDRCPTRSSGGA